MYKIKRPKIAATWSPMKRWLRHRAIRIAGETAARISDVMLPPSTSLLAGFPFLARCERNALLLSSGDKQRLDGSHHRPGTVSMTMPNDMMSWPRALLSYLNDIAPSHLRNRQRAEHGEMPMARTMPSFRNNSASHAPSAVPDEIARARDFSRLKYVCGSFAGAGQSFISSIFERINEHRQRWPLNRRYIFNAGKMLKASLHNIILSINIDGDVLTRHIVGVSEMTLKNQQAHLYINYRVCFETTSKSAVHLADATGSAPSWKLYAIPAVE